MTSTRYVFARVAQAFGVYRKSQRMSDAASEMHLLREAEAFLGAAIWQNVETIEALSVEYWNLRKLIKERDEIRSRLAACQQRLDQAHEARSTLLNNTPEENQELLDQRSLLLGELEQLADKRDRIVAEAREVRRAYVGLKMKLEVLAKEVEGSGEGQAQVDLVKSRLLELKTRFAELKMERMKVGELIDEQDVRVNLIEDKLKAKRQEIRSHASGAFQVIGEGNKEISALRSECGVVDTRMRQLYAEIGRYVSRNANHDPGCAAAAATHRGMVDVMRALRHSIALNHRLAGTA
jgi:chromosome segregation ATPase